jgi:hypothetical protein
VETPRKFITAVVLYYYSGAMQWNHLSEDLKNSETLSSFKIKIRQA